MKTTEKTSDLNRSEFLKKGLPATLMAMTGGVPIRAEDNPKTDEAAAEPKPATRPVNCAVIGCAAWGRELLQTLARMPNGPVAAVCDLYEPALPFKIISLS